MISHSSVQLSLARRLHERLSATGCHPRLDDLDISTSERWHQTLASWLSTCQVAVVLLSPDAIASPWVRYELSVLSHREHTERNMHLVLVYLGLSRDEVVTRPDFAPFRLAEIQSQHVYGPDLDDHELDGLVASIDALAEVDVAPVERLVARVRHELRRAAPDRVSQAWVDLDATADDPWLGEIDDERRGFARAYCSIPLDRTYRGLQTLAQDPDLTHDQLIDLVDYNVMTAFDSKAVERLRQAAVGEVRRALVTASTRAELVDVAVQTLYELHDTMFVHRFEINGPITGLTPKDIAEGLAHELRASIEMYDQGDPGEFLADMARRGHPVFAFLTSAAGITRDVLAQLEEQFPSVVFVVLSSPSRPMPQLAVALGVERAGPDVDDPMAWAECVAQERTLAEERNGTRRDLLRVKQRAKRGSWS
jgi:hypothetical protein